MDWTILWWILAGLTVAAGLAGTVVPALPGVPLVFAGLFVCAWIGDFQVVAYTDAAAKNAVFADFDRTGYTGVPRYRRVFANMVIVAKLDLVIYFYTVIDDRIADGTPVNGGVGANFHVIADAYAAQLGDFQVGILIPDKSKAIGADHRTGMQD